MFLAIDIGNTHIVFGAYEGKTLHHHWRVRTNRRSTADEYGVLMRDLFGAAVPPIAGIAVSSVVPPVTQILEAVCSAYIGVTPLVVGRGVRTGMPILYDDPQQLGTDRLVNAVAAYERTRGPTIVVDLGTATKFEYVSERGEYVGGAIAPGLGVAGDALFERAARLSRVAVCKPRHVVGRNTVEAIQSGLIYGYASLVDGVVRRMQREVGTQARVLATGGFAPLLAPESESIEEVHEFLTLEGLRLIYERNSAH